MINDLLNKLSAQEKEFLKQDIFSPYIKGGANIIVRLNGVIYRLKTQKFKKDGFGVFRATDANTAKFVRDAEPYEKDEYLGLLPKVELVLVYNVGRWLAYPSHTNSFKHRFGVEPRLTSVLCADNVEIMDSVEARFDGGNFWFDSIKFGSDVEKIEKLRDRLDKQNYSITDEVSSGLTPEERKAFEYAVQFHKEAHMTDIEKRLHNELDKYGAKLDGFTERGDNVSVKWRDSKTNSTYTSVLDKENLNVVVAGICLSGGDKVFDLQSLVGVCRQARNRGHVVHIGQGGMSERDYWSIHPENNEPQQYYDDDDYDDYY